MYLNQRARARAINRPATSNLAKTYIINIASTKPIKWQIC